MQVAKTLAYVRQGDGSTVQLAEGDTVPEGSDGEHVEFLLGRGVLGDAAPVKAAAVRGKVD